MGQYPLVGQRETLETLIYILGQAWNNHGRIVYIEGDAGIGKTVLPKMLEEEIKHYPELENANFTYGYSYENTGSQEAYQPFVEILERLAKTNAKQKKIADLPLKILKETGPDWLQMAQIVPGIGSALSASFKTAVIATRWFLNVNEKTQMQQSRSLVTQYINTILEIASKENLFILVIEDAHWIDDASCQLLLRLASKIIDRRVVVLVTYRPDILNARHPLKNVQQEMLTKNLAQVMKLTGFTEQQISELPEQTVWNISSP